MVKVIMLNGPKGAGKSSIAEYIAARRDDTMVLPIMDPIKVDAMQLLIKEHGLGIGAEELVNEIELTGMKDSRFVPYDKRSPRQIYTDYSRQLRQRSGELAVVKLWHKHVTQLVQLRRQAGVPFNYVIVPDVRFTYEARFIMAAWYERRCSLALIRRVNKDFFNDVGYYIEDAGCQAKYYDNELDIPLIAEQITKDYFK